MPPGLRHHVLPRPASPRASHSLSSPPSLTGTLTKSRPARSPGRGPACPHLSPHRPGLSSTSPQPMDHTLLDTMAPGESMSTADIFSLEIPSFSVELDSLLDEFRVAPCRKSVAMTDAPEGKAEPEEPENTLL
ncbi:hypothetical protein ANANG_G00294120 [Anguilla anguilla]|uniref:Uncharacterized protein n=1 Tax=Anguilla anguilla TaxID=7936 RepID=A0A9D3LLX2_ANGAN|nr:hypothetical protein ANANG_G00294120 [Anguilla anguilla]